MAVIALDRDGVINIDAPNYIKSAEEWIPIPGSIEAITILCKKGFKVYVATNQAGLARGLFSQDDLDAMHAKLVGLVQQAGGEISGIMYCPHHPDDNCHCRKPKPGLLEQIEQHANESMKGQVFVGDSIKDIEAAKTIGARPVLVLTGNGQKSFSSLNADDSSVETYPSLIDFAQTVSPATPLD